LAACGIFPPPPPVNAPLFGTKETARTKTAITMRTLEFILDEVSVPFFLTGAEVVCFSMAKLSCDAKFSSGQFYSYTRTKDMPL